MFGLTKESKKIIMLTFASTIISGVFSIAFSKNVIESKGVVNSASSFYDLDINDINGMKINLKEQIL